MTWVKICGTTTLHDAQLSVAAGADALGFIFAPSPRRVDPKDAAGIVAALPRGIESIGVFVNETPVRVAEVVKQVGLSGVQLHGGETADEAVELRQALGGCRIFKTFHANELADNFQLKLEAFLSHLNDIDGILLDSGSNQQRGGTGVPFSWDETLPAAIAIRAKFPLIIAGGLTAENVGRAAELFQPWGIDVVSAVESAPGKKDETKLRDFIAAVRRAQLSTV